VSARVVLYARVSTILQEDPGAQLLELERVGQARSWQIVAKLVERASGADRQRPELAKGIALLRAGRANVLASVSLDRVTRSTLHLLELIQELNAYRAELVCVRDGQLDTTTPTGRAFIMVRGIFAELERELSRERSREHSAVRRARGEHVGRPPGLDPVAQVPLLVELRRNGQSWSQVAAYARAQGWGDLEPGSVARTVTRAIAKAPPELATPSPRRPRTSAGGRGG
jgi:DNA invertase Pin-like site-specific DNA recombinase